VRQRRGAGAVSAALRAVLFDRPDIRRRALPVHPGSLNKINDHRVAFKTVHKKSSSFCHGNDTIESVYPTFQNATSMPQKIWHGLRFSKSPFSGGNSFNGDITSLKRTASTFPPVVGCIQFIGEVG
jgi:hypothetical protein